MAEGMIGANPEELLSLAKSMESSGSTLKQLSSSLHSAISHARWSGPDSERFKAQWNGGMRMTLRTTGDKLSSISTSLASQAKEQIQASAASGGSTPGSGGTLNHGGSSGGPDGNSTLQPFVDANGNVVYQWVNTLLTGAGFGADILLSKLVNAGLLAKAPWTLLGSSTSQLGQYMKGTQLLNGLSMAGRAMGVLSVIGGGLQLANGIMNGDTHQIIDGGITTVLAVGSFIPVVGPFFAAAGLVWAGSGLLANALGFSSTSAMFEAGGKWVGEKVSQGAQWVGEQTANVAKKAWGWLTGG